MINDKVMVDYFVSKFVNVKKKINEYTHMQQIYKFVNVFND